jgi:uncharacterized protein (TIGR03437 family)
MMLRFVACWLAVTAAGFAQQTSTLFATYFGGRGAEYGNAIAVGPDGAIWFAGTTQSDNLRVEGAFQPRCGGGVAMPCHDGFVARLSADGAALEFSTYLGGARDDVITDIAVDEEGYVYLTGRYNDGALAARLDPQGKPVYVLSIGGPRDTMGMSVAVRDGHLYITGRTSSAAFPVVNALYPSAGPPSCTDRDITFPIDAFVAKVAPDGTIAFATYIPGNGHDYGLAIAVDASGQIYVGGGTTSTDLPLPHAIQSAYRGGALSDCGSGDGFVLQFAADGSRVLFGTLLGGGLDDQVNGLAVEAGGVLVVTGSTNSGSGFPVTVLPQVATTRSFVARIDTAQAIEGGARARPLIYSQLLNPQLGHVSVSAAGTAFGGVGSIVVFDAADPRAREAGGVGAFIQRTAAAPDGTIVAVGTANSFSDFFRPVNPMQAQHGGSDDAFVVRLKHAEAARLTAVNAASFSGPELAPGSIATLFATEGGTEVRVRDVPASVIATGGGQVSFIVPPGIGPGAAAVTLWRDGAEVARGPVLIHSAAPAIFTANSDGRGAPAAQVVRVRSDGAREEQSPFECGAVCLPRAVDASDQDHESVLILYGTGLRNYSAPAQVRVVIDGDAVPVLFAGAQPTFPGLDQVNVRLPASLGGRGEVRLVLTVDGRQSKAVRLLIR